MAIVATAQRDVRVDNTELRKAIAVYSSVVKKTLANVVREQARLMCRDMVDFTPPFEAKPSTGGQSVGKGFTLKARNKGRASVDRDIRKIFAPLPQAQAGSVAKYGTPSVFAAWMDEKMKLPEPHQPDYIFKIAKQQGVWLTSTTHWDFFKQVESGAKSRKATFYMQPNMGDLERVHKRLRGNPHYRVNETKNSEKVYIDDFKMVVKYIKKTQQRVGKLKSGWWWAGQMLGKMRRADWISEQGSSTAIYRPQLTGDKPGVLIGNSIARKHTQAWHLFSLARNYRHFALRNQIIQILKGDKNRGRLLDAASKIKGIQLSISP